jgi:hypothetical protein
LLMPDHCRPEACLAQCHDLFRRHACCAVYATAHAAAAALRTPGPSAVLQVLCCRAAGLLEAPARRHQPAGGRRKQGCSSCASSRLAAHYIAFVVC